MKHLTLLSIATSLAMSTPVWAQPPAAPPVDLFKPVQTRMQEKKYAEAIAEAEQALLNTALTPNDKVRFLNAAAQASMNMGRTQIPNAIAFYERIVADTTIPNAGRIEALKNVANTQIRTLDGLDLFKMDLSNAHATLNRALELDDLKPEEQATALMNIGDLYKRQDTAAQARATYQQILALEVSDRTKANAQRNIADTFLIEGNAAEAIAIYDQNKWDKIALYQRLNDAKKSDEETTKLLNDTTLPENARWNQFARMPIWDMRTTKRDMAAVQKAWDTYMPGFLEKDPNRVTFIQRAIVANNADPNFVAWGAPLLLQSTKLNTNDTLIVRSALIEAHATRGNLAAAVQEASTLAADTNASASLRLWAQLVALAAKPVDAATIKATAQDASTLTNQQRSDAIIRAAKTMLRAKNFQAGRSLYDYHQSLLSIPARATITAEYSDSAPYDVGSWLASPLLKSAASKAALDRPYGDNLEFLLLTDSAMTGRNTTAQSKEVSPDTQTDFHTATDAEGIHLFFHASDSKAADVVAGLAGGGSFEMYLAPGHHQAYHTFLLDLPSGNVDPASFLTMYPNTTFRIPSREDGTFRAQTRATDKGFATHLFLSWDLFYDKLPVNGTKWQFESIRWTRTGGFSFGGSESVHNRSSWGDVVFSGLTPERLNAIKRGILFKAAARYKRAKHPARAIGAWADPDLADRAFYLAKVEPLIQQLDAYAARVNNSMSAAEVDTLFREAVPGWMETEFRIEALRAEYLKEKHLSVAQR